MTSFPPTKAEPGAADKRRSPGSFTFDFSHVAVVADASAVASGCA